MPEGGILLPCNVCVLFGCIGCPFITHVIEVLFILLIFEASYSIMSLYLPLDVDHLTNLMDSGEFACIHTVLSGTFVSSVFVNEMSCSPLVSFETIRCTKLQ
jgi:hypothetical protein